MRRNHKAFIYGNSFYDKKGLDLAIERSKNHFLALSEGTKTYCILFYILKK